MPNVEADGLYLVEDGEVVAEHSTNGVVDAPAIRAYLREWSELTPAGGDQEADDE